MGAHPDGITPPRSTAGGLRPSSGAASNEVHTGTQFVVARGQTNVAATGMVALQWRLDRPPTPLLYLKLEMASSGVFSPKARRSNEKRPGPASRSRRATER